MEDRIVARQITPTVITVQLGGLVTALLWIFYGYVAGVPALALSLFLTWRALQTGLVLDREGLLMRPFLPFVDRAVIPWASLASVDVDEVMVGTESRTKKLRLRVMIHGQGQPLQVIGFRAPTINKVLAAMQAKGVAVTDARALGAKK
ncbi:hypothetical protein ENSA5_58440 [Enhygromyxa salina]|uniref:PH domain-containing protein n=1 Tax=Enhygromyxa salina TaxID=215803 RepID=A0A2S9XE30_9BACT|nr:hypothetical protein [Enhygromyxa salina]PRP91107.1 hypothetical protein ENSA5_58440 [Enhygromyxa salina]